jgi:hypothetical protein
VSQKNRTFVFFGEKFSNFFSKITHKGYFHTRNRLHASKTLENAFQKFKQIFLKISPKAQNYGFLAHPVVPYITSKSSTISEFNNDC